MSLLKADQIQHEVFLETLKLDGDESKFDILAEAYHVADSETKEQLRNHLLVLAALAVSLAERIDAGDNRLLD